MTIPAAQIDVNDVQGDILHAYGNDYRLTSYLFIGVQDGERGRALLRGLLPRVGTDARVPGVKPGSRLNVALTSTGLAALGVQAEVVDTFAEEFRVGMAGRADTLGDSGPSNPDHWDQGLGSGAAHVLITINAQTKELLDDELGRLDGELVTLGGLTVVHLEHAKLLPNAREHFGYADGFAQPAIEGVSESRTDGGGVPQKNGKWRPLALGEFLIGYDDEDSREDPLHRPPSGPQHPIGFNGTYMVWRKLHQDVALFRRTLRDAAVNYTHGDEERLAAKVVGRWRNGSPLVTHDDRPDPNFTATNPDSNNFRYADDDSTGRRCPLGAHIRRSNPRDALDKDGLLSFRHRIIRRGMPYGEPLPEDADDDRADRGLVFVCFNASISRQFEGIAIQWLNDGNIFHLGHDRDFLLGSDSGTGKMTIQGAPPYFLAPQGPFVTTRGGEYLFVPGIAALKAIIDGVTG